MVLERIAVQAPLFLLVFTRIYVFLRVAPMTSSTSIPGIARTALCFLVSLMVFPSIVTAGYPVPDNALLFVLLLIGEGLIGVITALFLTIMFSVFQVGGQFFSLQMGFGASQVFDPLAQVEIPLMGQFLNVIAMMIFVFSAGFQKIFLYGIQGSFAAMRAVDLAGAQRDLFPLILGGLAGLFEQALILAFPILGTLFLLQITMGLFGKAAPQMNLLMLGFPAAIGVAFLVLFLTLPFLVRSFEVIIDASFMQMGIFYGTMIGGTP